MDFSIHLTEEERNLVNSYAKFHDLSLEDAFKKALFEKIEDEYDIAIVKQAYNEYLDSGKQSRSISKLWEELEI